LTILLTVTGNSTRASCLGVPVNAGAPPMRSRYLSRSGLAGLAAGREISGSVPTQNRSGLDNAFGVARRISRSPGGASASMTTLIVTVSIMAGLAVRFGGFLNIFARTCSRSAASAAVQTLVPVALPLREAWNLSCNAFKRSRRSLKSFWFMGRL